MNKEIFINECKKIGIIITEEMIKKLDIYRNLLYSWNEKINLTSITEEKEVYLKHFYDSLCLVRAINLNEKISLCDVGTGAGFPGIVLKIVFSNLNITLIEPIKKRCVFLEEVIKELNLKNIKIVNERAEIYSKYNREIFDIITCRAVSKLKIICEISIPMLKVNGYFIPLKGLADEEIRESEYILKELDAKIEDKIIYNLPIEDSKRTIIKIKKNNKTNKKYPRNFNLIKRS